jgi:teichuronic acid biosynthesis glycosyltransferase TuaC
LRILTFTTLFPHGADPTHCIFVYQRLAHLAQRHGYEVVVVSSTPYVPKWLKARRRCIVRDFPKEERIGNLTVYHPRYLLIPKISMPIHAFSMFIGSLFRVISLNKRMRFDCIDAHFVYPDGLAGLLLAKCLGVPIVISARGSDVTLYPSFRLIRPMIRWTLNHADAVIAVSAALKKAMLALGIRPRKIAVIPNGVDARRFYPIAKDTARRKLNLEEVGPLIVAVGALVPSKGHELLIRAFAQISPQNPRLQLYIIGEGPLRPVLEKLITKLGIDDGVHLPGKKPNEELPLWFSAADISCLASAREGWPNVVMESLACGTPVVATRVGGIPEIIAGPEFGILVDQSVESVAFGIEQALSKRWDRDAISEKVRARTWDTVAAEVDQTFNSLLQARAGYLRKQK